MNDLYREGYFEAIRNIRMVLLLATFEFKFSNRTSSLIWLSHESDCLMGYDIPFVRICFVTEGQPLLGYISMTIDLWMIKGLILQTIRD